MRISQDDQLFLYCEIGAFEDKLITKTKFFDTLADSHKTKQKNLEKNQATSYNLMVKIETKCSHQKIRTPNTSLYQVFRLYTKPTLVIIHLFSM